MLLHERANETIIGRGGVVAYPAMQAYGSLALEDNSEIDELVMDERTHILAKEADT